MFNIYPCLLHLSFCGNSGIETPSTAPARVSSTADLAEHPVPTSPTSTDGWGELENGIQDEHENDRDGWDELEPLEETKPAPALANIQAAQRRPVSQPISQTKQGIFFYLCSDFGTSFHDCKLLVTSNNFYCLIESYHLRLCKPVSDNLENCCCMLYA